MSPQLTLQFLGPPQILLNDNPIIPHRRTVTALLAYLALNPARQTREFLSSLFWSEYNQAKAFTNLRHTLWEVHQTLGEGWVISDRTTVSLNSEADISVDVTRFQDSLHEVRHQSDLTLRTSLLVDTVSIYRNHFLTGFSLRDASDFNEWIFTQSEFLRADLASALTLLVDSYLAQGCAGSAIPHARRLISLDPLNESAHRQMMEVYVQAGQHAAALKQYQTCEQMLRKELGIDPQPETITLYKKIRKHETRLVKAIQPEQVKTTKHNLPLQLTTFIGREKERDEVCDLLIRNRLVTLVGAGGIGKTRLALQVGEKLLWEHPDGIWFIALDALNNPVLVPQTVASVLEIKNVDSDSILERLSNVLREKQSLLILDNCEHLLDATRDLIEALLKNCPQLKILATSREILGVDGEAIHQVPSLSLPQNSEMNKLDEFESIKLFSERATLVLHTFTLHKENLDSITGICQIVDGIPLAIELASARVDILTPKEILEQLKKSFALLTHRGRSPVERHQSMRASMDWSWGLLTEQERVFLARLSVFSGGWTLDAAQAVCVDKEIDIESALELTCFLVKRSLVMVEQAERRVTRYRLHEIVRQYAHEKLVEAGEMEKIRNRHLKCFLELAGLAESALHGSQQMEWFSLINDEIGNIRSALEQASRTDLENGLYLSGRLNRYWEISDLREGLDWTTEFVQQPGSNSYPHGRAKALLARGKFLWYLQRFDTARSTADECITLFRACGDRQGEIDGLMLKGIIMQYLEGMEQKIELHKQALALAQSIGDIWRQANALSSLGWDQRDLQRSRNNWLESIALYRQVGDWRSLAFVLGVLGYTVLSNGDIDEAQIFVDESLEINRRMNYKREMEFVLTAKSHLALMRGEHGHARAFLQEWAVLAEELGNRMGHLWACARLGYISFREGNMAEARHIFVETVKSFHEDRNKSGLAFVLDKIASLDIVTNKPERAARLIGWSDRTREEIGNPRPLLEQPDVDRDLAACLAKMGEVAFSKAYDDGKKMTMDEAVSFALRED